jgi:hypothetical protein
MIKKVLRLYVKGLILITNLAWRLFKWSKNSLVSHIHENLARYTSYLDYTYELNCFGKLADPLEETYLNL